MMTGSMESLPGGLIQQTDTAYSSPAPATLTFIRAEQRSKIQECLSSSLFDRQVLVFHFPGVVHGVKGGVPNQVPERPLAGQFTL